MTNWRIWSGRWAAVLAGAVLAVAPAAARACDDEDDTDEHQSASDDRGGDRLKDEGSRQAYVRSVEKMGSDEERSRALVKLMADAPISEATGAAILEVASRMQSDQPLGRLLSFFHEIQESDLVRGPLAQKYLDAASHLKAPEALARALVQWLHPETVPGAAVGRALELSQRLSSSEGIARVLREVTDHQDITPDIEARVRALAAKIGDADLKARALERLERAKSGDRRERHSSRGDFHFPRFAFRFGDEGRTLTMPVPPVPPMPPLAPLPPIPPLAPVAPVPPVPPTPPAAEVPVPRDGEVSINGRMHTLTPEERDAIRESARAIHEQARRMHEQLRDQMRQMRRKLHEDLRRRGEREDIDGSEFDLDLDLNG